MKLREIYELIDLYAPFSLSDDYCKKTGFNDNSGIIIDGNTDITNVVFTLDLTEKAIEYAQWVKAGLIITHHPAIFYPVKRIDGNILKAANAGIAVISCHLNFDMAEKGIDYYLAKGVSGADDKEIEILEKIDGYTGYGRRYPVSGTLENLASHIEKEFNTKVIVYGDKNANLSTAASFCGAGLDIACFDTDADVYISADVKHHVIFDGVERGKNLIVMTHYASENYGLKRIYKHFSNIYRLKNKLDFYFFDNENMV